MMTATVVAAAAMATVSTQIQFNVFAICNSIYNLVNSEWRDFAVHGKCFNVSYTDYTDTYTPLTHVHCVFMFMFCVLRFVYFDSKATFKANRRK